MLKKLCSLLIFATVPLFSTATNKHQEKLTFDTTKSTQSTINETKKNIMLELQNILNLSNKALAAQKEVLKDEYDALYKRVMTVVHRIVSLPEFTQAINNMAELQKNNILFGTPINEEDFANLALANKINELLNQEFPSLDEQTEKLFNIMYVTIANILANKQLLNKLDAEAKNLTAKTKDK